MKEIFSKLCKQIENKSEYFDIFVKYRMRYEGWLETEILNYIDKFENVEVISTKKKYKFFSRRPDLVLKVGDETYLVEIKACLIEKSPKPRGIPFYFKTQLIKDFRNIGQSNENEFALTCFCPCKGSMKQKRSLKYLWSKNLISSHL